MFSHLKTRQYKVNWYYVLPVVAVLLIVYAFVNFSLSNRIHKLEIELQKSTAQAISIHEKLGYGGLIHNFKNYVLRGDLKYLDAAQGDAAEAIQELTKFEQSARDQGLDVSLTQTRLMIEAYSSRLETIQMLLDRGTAVEDIDLAVQFDDSDALLEINRVLDIIQSDIEGQLQALHRISLIQTTATVVASMFIVFFALLLSRISMHRAELQNVNDDLSVTLDKTERANEALSQFAGVASHDLRTPIRHIKLFADMITEDAENPDEVRAHAANIQKSANRMNALVKSLLTFAKTSNAELERSKTDLNELAKSVIDELQPQIKEAGAVIKLGDLPTLNVDRTLMRQVFVNLLDNAIKYSEAGRAPEIEIDAVRVNDIWEFRFTDNGIGIEPQYADKIFLPLQRLHSHSSDYQGVGIGLALVKNVIEAHAGQLRLDTEYKSGTRFIFTL